MLYIIDNILNKKNLDILLKQYENFIQNVYPDENNSYNRMLISESIISLFSDNLKQILFEKLNTEYLLLPNKSVWVNYVDTESNKNDSFHFDASEVSIVIYLNENFKGGELEYIDESGNKIIYIPKTNSGLIMTNKLLHRVLPVTEGERYSLVCFFENKNTKIKKTLL